MSDKIEQFYRPATPDDVARVMRGEKVEARFRDYEHRGWWSSVLNGWRDERESNWLDNDGAGWKQCQVYDPQQWWLDKPDPGKGYRLLGKFPDEDKLGTDEAWDVEIREWRVTSIDDGIQVENVWYRRRIANNPEIPDGCRSRDTIPSGWRLLGEDEERLASDAYWSLGAKDWIVIGDDRVGVANELPKWYAIRQVLFYDHQALQVNGVYGLPNGSTIRITAKGFEVV